MSDFQNLPTYLKMSQIRTNHSIIFSSYALLHFWEHYYLPFLTLSLQEVSQKFAKNFNDQYELYCPKKIFIPYLL